MPCELVPQPTNALFIYLFFCVSFWVISIIMSSNSPIIYSEASNLLIPVYFFTSETIIFIYPSLICIFHIFFMSLFNMLILYFLNIWSIFIIAVLMSLCINFSICFYRLTCLLIMGISSCFFACMPFLIEC